MRQTHTLNTTCVTKPHSHINLYINGFEVSPAKTYKTTMCSTCNLLPSSTTAAAAAALCHCLCSFRNQTHTHNEREREKKLSQGNPGRQWKSTGTQASQSVSSTGNQQITQVAARRHPHEIHTPVRLTVNILWLSACTSLKIDFNENAVIDLWKCWWWRSALAIITKGLLYSIIGIFLYLDIFCTFWPLCHFETLPWFYSFYYMFNNNWWRNTFAKIVL